MFDHPEDFPAYTLRIQRTHASIHIRYDLFSVAAAICGQDGFAQNLSFLNRNTLSFIAGGVHIQITFPITGIGVCPYPQQLKFILQIQAFDLLFQLFLQFALSQHIPTHRYQAFLLQQGHSLYGHIVAFLGGEPSHRQDPDSLKVIRKPFALPCHPADPALVDHIMENGYPIPVLRVNLQKMFLYLIRHGENMVHFPVTVQIQIFPIPCFLVINMYKSCLFSGFHSVCHVICGSAFQIGHRQIICFFRLWRSFRQNAPAELIRLDPMISLHPAKIFQKISRPSDKNTFADAGLQYPLHQKLSALLRQH